MRHPFKYCSRGNCPFNERQWIYNRLRLIRQFELFNAYAGAFGAAMYDVFLKLSPGTLKSVMIPHAGVHGSAHANDFLKITRLRDGPISYIF